MGMEVQVSGAHNLTGRMGFAPNKELRSVARLWIRQALTSVLQGDDTSYDNLIQELSNIDAGDPVQEANLVMTLKALSQAVSSINEHHHGTLLSCVLGMSFWNYSLNVADVLMEFIINLATSNGGFVDKCLDMLIRSFLPPSCGLRLHMDSLTRRQILELVPTAALRLQPIILRRMPHRIIHKDVEIRWEHILHEDSSKVYVFEMEMEEDEGDPGYPDSEGNVQFAKSSDGKQSLDEVADKMDALMELALNHLNICAHEGLLPQVYNTLMHSFQSTILNTHKSKFTQFLIFNLCSLAPETCGANFASLLCDIFVTKSRSLNTRMTAIAYLASDLARAKYLSLYVISASLKRLVDWCLQYTPQQNNERKNIGSGLHGVFFSACQAIMYVLCFRLKLLMNDPQERLLIEELPLKKILEHKLNPLNVCLPSVVEEYLRQVKAVHLFDISQLTSANKMLETEESKAFGVERLDIFFPIDLYLLKQSDRFVRPNFIFWSMVLTLHDEDDLDGQEDHMISDPWDRDFENEEKHTLRGDFHEFESDNEEFEEFECAMKKMSVTPKRTAFRVPAKLLSPTESKSDMPARLYPSAI